jgi:hypothetical protein
MVQVRRDSYQLLDLFGVIGAADQRTDHVGMPLASPTFEFLELFRVIVLEEGCMLQ